MVSTNTRTGTGTGAQDLCLVNCSGIPGLEISQEEAELSPVAPLGDKSSPTLVRYQKWAWNCKKKTHKTATETEERGQAAVPLQGLRDSGTSPRGGGPLEGSAV